MEWVYVVIATSSLGYILDSMQVFKTESEAKIYARNFATYEIFSKKLR